MTHEDEIDYLKDRLNPEPKDSLYVVVKVVKSEHKLFLYQGAKADLEPLLKKTKGEANSEFGLFNTIDDDREKLDLHLRPEKTKWELEKTVLICRFCEDVVHSQDGSPCCRKRLQVLGEPDA